MDAFEAVDRISEETARLFAEAVSEYLAAYMRIYHPLAGRHDNVISQDKMEELITDCRDRWIKALQEKETVQ